MKNLLYIMHTVNEKSFLISVLAVIIAFGVAISYGQGVTEYNDDLAWQSRLATYDLQTARQVLGVTVNPGYINPFSLVNLKAVKFPIAQLKGCRNYQECSNFCAQPASFPACAAWSRSQ